jgi:hypothetical protein
MEDTKLNVAKRATERLELKKRQWRAFSSGTARATTAQTDFCAYPPESGLLYETQPAQRLVRSREQQSSCTLSL